MDKKKLLALTLALLVLFASASTVQAVEVVKTIPFVGYPAMVYDSYKGAVWVAPDYLSGYGVMGLPIYLPTNTVIALSDNDSSVLANITLGSIPVAYDSALHEVYLNHDGSVTVISDMKNSVVATIELCPTLHLGSMVYDSGKGEIFAINCTNDASNVAIVVISCFTKQVVATIPLGNYPSPNSLTYDWDKGEIYVSCSSFDEQKPNNYVSVISDSNNSVITTIPLGNSTRYVEHGAYDSATGEIYLPAINDAVLVVSDKTHNLVDVIPCPTGGFGSNTNIAYDPVKSVIFVGSEDGKTRIISDITHKIVETIRVRSSALVYDSGLNVMISMGDRALNFISDASLPDPPPTSTPTPTSSPSPSVLQNPVFLGLGWVQIAILVVMGIIALATGVAAFRFLRKEGGQSKPS
jgi:DNA-binding beta-propeller fold protein YncE